MLEKPVKGVQNASRYVQNTVRNAGAVQDALRGKNNKVILSLLPPALRGLILQRGKGNCSGETSSTSPVRSPAT